MPSTIYDDSMEKITVAGQEVNKPAVCINYKRNHMAGVDLMDQILSAVNIAKKGVKKYYKKIFFRLIEICLQNAHCIYKKNGGRKNLLDFRLQLIEKIFRKYLKDVFWQRSSSLTTLGQCPTHLTGRHFPKFIRKEGEQIEKTQR